MFLDDKIIVEIQIDREINNFIKTIKYCPFDFPAVVKVKPFAKGVVAPTLYWLSCPHLNYEVDLLESETDLLNHLTAKLKSDLKFKKEMDRAHKDYAEKRKKLLLASELNNLKSISYDLFKTLTESGVGGIKEKDGLKCLHTHLADFLAGGKNPAGEIVFKKIKWPNDCKICQGKVDDYESSSS